MDTTRWLAVLAAAIVGATAVIATTDRQRVALLLGLSIPQFYLVHVGAFYISTAVALSLLLLPVALLRLVEDRPRGAGFVMGFLLVEALSLVWSADLKLGLRTILYQVPFLVTLSLGYSAYRQGGRRRVPGIAAFAVGAAVEALAVIAFRVAPSIEEHFLTSGFGNLFVNPNALSGLFTISPDNVLDAGKAGGVFTNANVAAAFLGLATFSLIAVAHLHGQKIYRSTAFLTWAAVFFTGSTMGALLALAAPIGYWALDPARRAGIRITAFTFGVAGVAAVTTTGHVNLASDKAASVSSRLLIWDFAGHEFLRTPFLGHGFGGWQLLFPVYAAGRDLQASFPPHDSLIYAWSQSGLFGASAALAGLVTFAAVYWRLVRSRSADHKFAAACLVGLAWVFGHGFFENFGLLGEEHMQPIIAIAIACAAALSTRTELLPRPERLSCPKPSPSIATSSCSVPSRS